MRVPGRLEMRRVDALRELKARKFPAPQSLAVENSLEAIAFP
jgi:hypothetical protein